MKLSIVIVNYNGKHFLDDCLNSIAEHVSCEHEVIVVDNASSDGSVAYLRNVHPGVVLVESESNLGFTGGNNLGVRHAKGRYVLLLNNDTIISTSISPMLSLIESDESVGVVGGRLRYGDGRQQESVGYTLTPVNLVFSWTPLSFAFPYSPIFRRTVRADSQIYNQVSREVSWVSGAFLLTRKDLWRRLGGLDEQYFMYMEDADYCRRVGNEDLKVVYSSSCQIVHFEGAGKAWVGERALINTTNSYLIYVAKFYNKFSVFFLRTLLAPTFVLRSFAFFLISLFDNDEVKKEKSIAYLRAALLLCGV